MKEKLLYYYNNELQIIQKMAAEFAAEHPKEAANLRISTEAYDDPHISRLLQGIAFLNARIMHKLDDEFPELIDSLLNIIYPHYLKPIPSFSVISFEINEDSTEPYFLPRGTKLESDIVDNQICRFETCYPLTVYPIKLSKAEFLTAPFTAPSVTTQHNIESVLHLEFKTHSAELKISEIQPASLIIYLNGQLTQIMPLYEMLFNNSICIAVATSHNDCSPLILPIDSLKQIGFDEDHSIINYSSRSLIAYRFLTEYFVFPYKFLFFELDLVNALAKEFSNKLSVYIYFNKRDAQLEKVIGKNHFKMNCTPVTNKFTLQAEPILFNNEKLEYRVIPDARHQGDVVVHDILSVSAVDAMGQKRCIRPFFFKNDIIGDNQNIYWTATQRSGISHKRSIDTFLSLTGDIKLLAGSEFVLSTEVMCSNGTFPSRLPYGGGNPKLYLTNGSGPIKNILCLMPPTNIVFNSDNNGRNTKLLSHLALNHLSLSGQEGLISLKEMLKLYNILDQPDINRVIDGIIEINVRKVTARAPRYEGDPAWIDTMCQGLEIEMYFDEINYPGGSFFLFSSILDRFLAAYSTINSFTIMCVKHRSRSEVLIRWPPRAGLRYTL